MDLYRFGNRVEGFKSSIATLLYHYANFNLAIFYPYYFHKCNLDFVITRTLFLYLDTIQIIKKLFELVFESIYFWI